MGAPLPPSFSSGENSSPLEFCLMDCAVEKERGGWPVQPLRLVWGARMFGAQVWAKRVLLLYISDQRRMGHMLT